MCSYSWRVPFHAFGELTIVASGEIGDLGPAEGEAIAYHWRPLYNLAGVLPWLLVVAAFVLLKENRRGQALWILFPVLVIKGILWGIVTLLSVAGMPSQGLPLFHALADCLLIGFAMNWLLAERIGHRNRFAPWLLAVIVFAAVWGVSLVGIGTGIEAAGVSIMIGVTVAILMLAFALAGFHCRKTFGPIQFCLWTALWVLVFTVGLFLVVALIQIMSMGLQYAAMMLLGILMVGGIYGGVLVVALLPFEIILLANTFWRKRFEAVFGIKAPTPPTFEGPAVQADVNGDINHEAHEEPED